MSEQERESVILQLEESYLNTSVLQPFTEEQMRASYDALTRMLDASQVEVEKRLSTGTILKTSTRVKAGEVLTDIFLEGSGLPPFGTTYTPMRELITKSSITTQLLMRDANHSVRSTTQLEQTRHAKKNIVGQPDNEQTLSSEPFLILNDGLFTGVTVFNNLFLVALENCAITPADLKSLANHDSSWSEVPFWNNLIKVMVLAQQRLMGLNIEHFTLLNLTDIAEARKSFQFKRNGDDIALTVREGSKLKDMERVFRIPQQERDKTRREMLYNFVFTKTIDENGTTKDVQRPLEQEQINFLVSMCDILSSLPSDFQVIYHGQRYFLRDILLDKKISSQLNWKFGLPFLSQGSLQPISIIKFFSMQFPYETPMTAALTQLYNQDKYSPFPSLLLSPTLRCIARRHPISREGVDPTMNLFNLFVKVYSRVVEVIVRKELGKHSQAN